MIYLDNNATTRVAPEVLDAMQPYLSEFFGNPSSAHALGREMKRAIDNSREQVAVLIGAAETSEIVFTSCGSESDNWAIRGVLAMQPQKKHIVTTQVEHEAVRNVCRLLEKEGYEVTWLGVDAHGELDLEELRYALRPDTALVSIMLANNETGVLFPIEEIGRVVREKSEAVFHVDGVQAVGKVPIDLKNTAVDLFALSGHKLHAPQGIGALRLLSVARRRRDVAQVRPPFRTSSVLAQRASSHSTTTTTFSSSGCAIVSKTRSSQTFRMRVSTVLRIAQSVC
jgi:cysteine desulfurase